MPEIGEIRKGKEIGYKYGNVKYIWSSCIDCGKERWVQFIKGKPIFKRCKSCSKRGNLSSQWKGGRVRDKQGYILVKLQPDDFFYSMANKHRQVFEHRLVMAKYVKRCLLPWEVVHHKNGIKDDNRLENLELLPAPKYHLVDSATKSLVKKLEREMEVLRGRVTFLEAENVALRTRYKIQSDIERYI